MLPVRRLALPLALLTALGACGTPQEQCINRSTRELRTIDRLLAEVEGNLARGYAWETYQVVRTRWEVCGYTERQSPDGTVIRKPRMCLEDYTDTLRRRVPIDPAAEQRKRDGLIARRAQEMRQAEANIAACKTTYPE